MMQGVPEIDKLPLIFFCLIFLSFIYVLLQLIRRRRFDNRCDKKLNIETQGLMKFKGNPLYNRTESTPYLALEEFASKYKVDADSKMVDFGSGKGRVSLYLSDKLNIQVKGIEANSDVLKKALVNLEKNSTKKVLFEDNYAENYKIEKEENLFFFFNPFHVDIFKQVVDNIVNSSKEHDKEVEIILYYPMRTYKDYLDKTDFKLIQEIHPKGRVVSKEQFIIYRRDIVN